MEDVNRDSANDKIMGLVQANQSLFDEMEHVNYLKSKIVNVT